MAEKQFPVGMRCYRPSEKAPEFVLADVVIDVTTLTSWLEDNTNVKGEVRLQILKSREGAIYMAKNTYEKPKEEITTEDSPF